MHRILLFFLILISLNLNAQNYSTLRPTLVVWAADGEHYSLRRAAYGIAQPQRLTLEVYFRQQDLRGIDSNFTIEFRWYYYLSTRRKFVKSQMVKLSEAQRTKDGAIKFVSTLETVQPGWWEVQIINSKERRLVRFANLDRFQIFIRRPLRR